MKYFAVIGKPISHSMSPDIMQAAFTFQDLEAHYSRVLLKDMASFELIDRLLAFQGINITAPFKKDAITLAEELSDSVKEIGVVNTMCKSTKGKWKAFNTDICGAVYPLLHRWGHLNDRSVLVLGAGGAARAAVCGLVKEGVKVTIANRTLIRAQKLADEFSCSYMSLDEIKLELINFDAIVNTVAVLPAQLNNFRALPHQLLLDASYAASPFLGFYKENDPRYISGKEWLIGQALEGFEYFTGNKVAEEIMYKGMAKALTKPQSSIFLIGPMGSGKTSVGKELAKLSGYDFRDMDDLIEKREGKTVKEIFNSHGEVYFRQLEKVMLRELSLEENIILSSGGGVVTQEENRNCLKERHTVLLLVDPSTSVKRNFAQNRPLLEVDNSFEKAAQLWVDRRKDYFTSAHVIVNGEDLKPKDLAAMIWEDFLYARIRQD